MHEHQSIPLGTVLTSGPLLYAVEVLVDDSIWKALSRVADPLCDDDALVLEALLDGHRTVVAHPVATFVTVDVQ